MLTRKYRSISKKHHSQKVKKILNVNTYRSFHLNLSLKKGEYPHVVGFHIGNSYSVVTVPEGDSVSVIENVEGFRLTPSLFSASPPQEPAFYELRDEDVEFKEKLMKQIEIRRKMLDFEENKDPEKPDEVFEDPEYLPDFSPLEWLEVEGDDDEEVEEVEENADNSGEESSVGNALLRQIVLNKDNIFYGTRYSIGRKINDPIFPLLQEKLNYRLGYDTKSKDGSIAFLDCFGTDYSPTLVTAYIIDKMKKTVEDSVGSQISRVSVTYPESFGQAQKDAMKEAFSLNEIDVVDTDFISDPIAAILAYNIKSKGVIAVFDMGGFSFDVSLVKEDIDGSYQVIARKDDPFLGGEDFTKILMEYMFSLFEKEHGVDVSKDIQATQRVRDLAEQLKRELSTKQTIEINLPFLSQAADGTPLHLLQELSRPKFHQLVSHLLDRTTTICEQCLEEAEVKTEDITHVIVIGGMGRVPMVREQAQKIFKKEPLLTSINPDEAVAIGACLFGNKVESAAEDEDDVEQDWYQIPLNVGLEMSGGIVKNLIPIDEYLPLQSSFIFSTFEDYQTKIDFTTCFGNRIFAQDNKNLGTITFDNLEPQVKGYHKFKLDIDIDVSLNFKIDVTNRRTGETQSIQYENSTRDNLKKKQFAEMIKDATEKEDDDLKRVEQYHNKVNHSNKIVDLEEDILYFGAHLTKEHSDKSTALFDSFRKLGEKIGTPQPTKTPENAESETQEEEPDEESILSEIRQIIHTEIPKSYFLKQLEIENKKN